MEYDTLVLAGGAIRGFALLGAIQYLQDRGWLQKIRKFIGTSIGAIIGYLICIGYSPVEIMVVLCQKDFFERLASLDLVKIIHGKGAISFNVLRDVLERMTIKKIGRFITLKELYDNYGKILICSTYNWTRQRNEYLNMETAPHLPCLVALQMTSSLPFLFEPVEYERCLYIDGGVSDNFSLHQCSPEDRVLGINLVDTTPYHEEEESHSEKDMSFFMMWMKLMRIPVEQLESIRNEHVHAKVIRIDCSNFSPLELTISNTDKFDLFSRGYETACNECSEENDKKNENDEL